jgi:polyferredoxin
MLPKGKNLIRLLWVILLVVFMAAVLPRPLGHPYPAFIEPYIVFGGILLYVIGGLGIVAFARRSQKRSAK